MDEDITDKVLSLYKEPSQFENYLLQMICEIKEVLQK
jgi:hypothetical protein